MTKAGKNYLQSCQYEEDGEVDHDHHVQVLLIKDVGEVADEQQDDGGDEHSEDVRDQRSSEADFNVHSFHV